MVGWWLLACGTDPAPIRSVPAPATKDLRPEEEAVVFTDLAELLPPQMAALPAPFASLTPGMVGEAARAVLEKEHEPGVKLFGEAGETQYALSSLLRGHNNVEVTLIFDLDGQTLREVSLALPDEVAIPMLTSRWGPPTEQVPGDQAKVTMRWIPASGPWKAELLPRATREKAILRYLPR